MTKAEVKRALKHLQAAVKIVEESAVMTVALTTTALPVEGLDEATDKLERMLKREACPSCKQILRSWHDHKNNCKEA